MEIANVAAILGLSWLRVWTGADADAAPAAVAAARAGGIGRFQGYCPIHKDTPKWWDAVMTPVPGPDGRPERLVSSGRDITARKRVEAALLEINATLEQQVEQRERERDRAWRLSQDLLVVAEADGTLVAINADWMALLGWEERELVGTRSTELVHPDDLEATLAAFAGIFEDGQVYANRRHTTAARTSRPTLSSRPRNSCASRRRWRPWASSPGPGARLQQSPDRHHGQSGAAADRDHQGRLSEINHYVAAAQGASAAAALTHRLLAFRAGRRSTPGPPTPIA